MLEELDMMGGHMIDGHVMGSHVIDGHVIGFGCGCVEGSTCDDEEECFCVAQHGRNYGEGRLIKNSDSKYN